MRPLEALPVPCTTTALTSPPPGILAALALPSLKPSAPFSVLAAAARRPGPQRARRSARANEREGIAAQRPALPRAIRPRVARRPR